MQKAISDVPQPDQLAPESLLPDREDAAVQFAARPDILPLLQQLFSVPDASGHPEITDFLQRMASQRRVVNALHELAETLYELGSYQITEQMPLLHNSLLLQLLQQGRMALYIPSLNDNALSPSSASVDAAHPLDSPEITPQELLPDTQDQNLQDQKMPYFQIPNARAGQLYHGQIKTQGADGQLVVLNGDSIVIAQDVGIAYNQESNSFEGIPARAGEFEIRFQYQNSQSKAQQWLDGSCTFIVTADPRSLWQVKEPNPDEPYQKAHQQQQLIQAGNFSIAAASRRGRSHEHAGSFRDDEVYVQQIADSDWSIMLVADGAGSAPFSREGSRLAVQEAASVLAQFIEQARVQLDAQLAGWQIGAQDQATTAITNDLYKQFYDLFYRVTQQAIQRIEQEATHRAVAAKAFATTLLAAVVRQSDSTTFVSSFWVGDGAIAVYGPEKMRLMGTPDAGEFAGQTRFLDKSIVQQFNQRVNIGYYDNVHAVVLLTDGVSDPRFETDAGLASQQKWDALWQEWQPCLTQPQPDSALLEWMHFFQPGHHDDRSLALLWRPALVQVAVDATSATDGEGV